MIEHNLPLVHSVANRFRERGVEYDDLYQAGCLGLVKAVDGFDASKGFRFSTYAVPVIMGEIRRLFRDGGQIKISRTLKENARRVQSLREQFVHHNGREPTLSELSHCSGFSAYDLSEILNASNPIVSLYATDEDGNEAVLDIPIDDSDALFNRIVISHALSRLPQRDKTLIIYRYFQGKTQTETARLLHISQVQVSRRERALLLQLRQTLQ